MSGGGLDQETANSILSIIGAASDSSLAPLSCGCTYYKCASVDTSAKTWSGYKAVWGDNGYTISDDLTEGLVYIGMTPQVGMIYDSTCSVRVAAL